MIINTSSGRAKNNQVQKSIRLDANHYFYTNGQKQYLEIPDVELSTGKVNSFLLFTNGEITTDRFALGAIYHVYWTTSVYDTGVVKVEGGIAYRGTNGLGYNSPIYPTDGRQFLYDESTQKLRVFLPIYNHDQYIPPSIYFDVIIW